MSEHVYILGAGFSVPLGGPLFTQLLTTELWNSSIYDGIDESLRTAVKHIHGKYGSNPIEKQLGLSRKIDAEELLERLDSAERNPTSRFAQAMLRGANVSLIENRLQSYFEKLNRCLKNIIAAQCQSFLNELEDDSERLDPYLAWARYAHATDTIVTFNYDTAVERAFKLAMRPLPEPPGSFMQGRPQLFKLHGSVDWHICNQTGALTQRENAYREFELNLALGIPGRGKAKIREVSKFNEIWRGAELAIKNAAVISVIGYSMPATDNRSRMTILKAISENNSPNLRVNLVLGPDSGTVRARRIVSMIQPLLGNRGKVFDIPMYAQDYLSRVSDYATYGFPFT